MTVTTTNRLPDVTRSDVGIVLISRWYVGTPERQRAVADALVAQWERTRWPDGFVSATPPSTSTARNDNATSSRPSPAPTTPTPTPNPFPV